MGKRRKSKRCAKMSCRNDAVQNHHFLPYRFYKGNPFKVKLCEECHAEADRLTEGHQKTPDKYFRIIFNFIYEV